MANKKLATTITIGGAVTAGLRSAVGSTQTMLRGVGKELDSLRRRQRLLGESIDTFGRMGKNVDGLRAKYAAAVAATDRLRAAQKRLNDAQARSDRINVRAGTVAKVGATATVAGGALIAAAVPGVKEAKHYETEKGRIASLGLGDSVSKEAVQYASQLKTYGTSMVDNLELTRDALSIFTTMHDTRNVVPTLAKMKFGNAAMFGEKGVENSTAFMDMLKVVELRGGAHSKEDFEKQADLIQKIVSATGGRVGASEWRNVISTGGIAAKLTRDDAFYFQLEPLVQMLGGDRVGTGLSASYSSLYQGRTTKRAAMNLEKYGLIGDPSKVKHDKVGQTAQLNPGALLGSDLFRQSQYEWVKQVLLPQLAKKGVTDDKEVVDVIASLVSNRKGADMLAAMVMQRGLIDKDEAKNRGAFGVNDLDAKARELAAGKEAEAEAKLADAKLKMGNEVMPIYIKALEMGTDALKAFSDVSEKNPGLSRAIIVGLTGIGVGLAVIGPLLTVAGGAMTAYAAIQLRAAANATAAAAAITTETEAIVAQGAAASTAGSKLAAFAKRAAIGLVVANVADYAAGKLGVGKEKADQGQDDKNWSRMSLMEKGQSSVLRGIEHVGSFVGMTNIADQAKKDRVDAETKYLDKFGPKQPELPTMRGNSTPAAPAIGTQTNTINVHQQPGEDADALADKILEKLERQSKVKSRSGMADD